MQNKFIFNYNYIISQLIHSNTNMIRLPTFTTKNIFKTMLSPYNRYLYIKHKDMEAIRDSYPQKNIINQTKIILLIVKLLCVQGFKDGKSDIKTFLNLRKIAFENRSHAEQLQYQSIKSDIIKALPAFIILNVPFGGPLFFLYLELFPTFAPTWVLTESIYQRIIQTRKENRQIAYQFFSNKFGTFSANELSTLLAIHYDINLKNSTSVNFEERKQLRMISNLLMGYYEDGTYYLTHLSPFRRINLQLNYLFSPDLSKLMLTNKIQSFVNNDRLHYKQLSQLSTFEQKLIFELKIRLQKLQDKAF